MNNDKIFSWGHNRRFNAYSNYFKQQFGRRIQKVTIDAGFTCPNRDGIKSVGGCTFCDNDAFSPSYCVPSKSIEQQINEGVEFHERRYRRATEFLAYFQAYSNTYAPLSKLKEVYQQAIDNPNIIGIVIGTRPDCIDEEKLDYFAELSKKIFVTIEYGVESVYDKTLARINRGHDFDTAKKAIQATADRNIKTGAHFIFGLPGETMRDMLDSVDIISELPLNSIKFHQLQIIKNTAIEKEYAEKLEDFAQFTMQEYIEFFIKYIERLNPKFVVERFVGEAPPRYIATDRWEEKLRNDQIINLFEKRLQELDTYQGRLFQAR